MPGPPRLPDDVAAISLPTPFAIGRVNAYLLEGDPLTLVDPGPQMEETRRELEAGLAEHGRRLEDIELVLLTHQHHDHIGLAHAVTEASRAEIAALPILARFMEDFELSMDLDDRYAVATMLRHGVDEPVAESLRELSVAFRRFARGAHVDRRVEEGQRIRAGRRELTVLHRPGHSPTDTLFLDEADGTLLGGDHLLEDVSSNPVAHWPIDGRVPEELPADPGRRRPLIEYLESMRRTSELDISLVLPGHGSPFTGHRGLVERRSAMHARRAAKILASIETAATAAEIGRRLWRRVPVTQAYLVLSEVLGHLDLLEADGGVREVADAGVVRYEPTGGSG